MKKRDMPFFITLQGPMQYKIYLAFWQYMLWEQILVTLSFIYTFVIQELNIFFVGLDH